MLQNIQTENTMTQSRKVALKHRQQFFNDKEPVFQNLKAK